VIKNTQIYKIEDREVREEITNIQLFNFYDVYFNPVQPTCHLHRNRELKYAKITSISQSYDNDHPKHGFLVISGEFGRRKHMHWVINDPDSSNKKHLDEKIINEYEECKKSCIPGERCPCIYFANTSGC